MPLKGGVIWSQSFQTSSTSLFKNGNGFLLVCIKMESRHEIPLETVKYYSNGKPRIGTPTTWPLGPALPLEDADPTVLRATLN